MKTENNDKLILEYVKLTMDTFNQNQKTDLRMADIAAILNMTEAEIMKKASHMTVNTSK